MVCNILNMGFTLSESLFQQVTCLLFGIKIFLNFVFNLRFLF